ncbi:MAG: hypothetical protein ACRDRJ_24975 [Streptosporangiaceae bacterium]
MKQQVKAHVDLGTVGKLEVNPNGQWAFIEQAAGLPIAAAIADALTRGESPA